MDPNATLKLIEVDLRNRFYREAREHCAALAQWLNSGGFQPDWKQYPKASKYFRTRYQQNAA